MLSVEQAKRLGLQIELMRKRIQGKQVRAILGTTMRPTIEQRIRALYRTHFNVQTIAAMVGWTEKRVAREIEKMKREVEADERTL